MEATKKDSIDSIEKNCKANRIISFKNDPSNFNQQNENVKIIEGMNPQNKSFEKSKLKICSIRIIDCLTSGLFKEELNLSRTLGTKRTNKRKQKANNKRLSTKTNEWKSLSALSNNACNNRLNLSPGNNRIKTRYQKILENKSDLENYLPSKR